MKLIDTNRYYLKGTNKRWLHLATATEGLREFACLTDKLTGKFYIEEMTSGNPTFIEDDILAQELHNFFVFHKILLMDRPLIPDKDWYNLKPNENK